VRRVAAALPVLSLADWTVLGVVAEEPTHGWAVGDLSIVAEVTAGAVNALGLHTDARVWAAVKATEIAVFPS
jgi:molybdopterin-binding protein